MQVIAKLPGKGLSSARTVDLEEEPSVGDTLTGIFDNPDMKYRVEAICYPWESNNTTGQIEIIVTRLG